MDFRPALLERPMRAPNRLLTISPEIHVFHKGADTVLYHRLTMAKFYCRNEMASLVTSLQKDHMSEFDLIQKIGEITNSTEANEIIKGLVENEFLVTVDSENQRLTKESLWRQLGPAVPKNLRLLVTHQCNFTCDYCQIELNLAPEKVKQSMSRQTVDAAFDVFNKVAAPTGKTVIITGGEPMLNLDVVRYIVQEARDKFGQVRIVLFTNGYRANQDTASFMANHDVQVLVSLDGPVSKNTARLHRTVQYAHDLALNAYREYKSSGCETGISAVAGTHNIEALDTEVISFFLSLKPSSLGLNFSHYLIGQDNPTLIPMARYVDKLLDTYKVARRHGLFIEQLSRVLLPFATGAPRVRECSAVGKGITVDSSGMIGTCKIPLVANQLGMSVTQVGESFLRESPFAEWHTRSPFTIEQCNDCYALGVCGGGCATDAWISSGSYWNIDPRACEFTKGLLDFFLWDLLDQQPGWMTGDRSYYTPSPLEVMKTYPEYFANAEALALSVGHQVE